MKISKNSVLLFGLPKHIALKIVKSTCLLQKTFINFKIFNFRLLQQKIWNKRQRRAKCSQTTGEPLASSVASHRLVRLPPDYLKGRKVTSAGCTAVGVQKWSGDWCGGGGWGVGSISKNRPSNHKNKSLKLFMLIACLRTSGLNGSKRN